MSLPPSRISLHGRFQTRGGASWQRRSVWRSPVCGVEFFESAAGCAVTGDEPRFLSTIRPTQFNYPIDILGKWHGTKCRFIQRFRSGFQENLGEFDATEPQAVAADPIEQAKKGAIRKHPNGPDVIAN
jgi:hypothetical protein